MSRSIRPCELYPSKNTCKFAILCLKIMVSSHDMQSGPGYSLSCALGWVINDRAIVLDNIPVRESRALLDHFYHEDVFATNGFQYYIPSHLWIQAKILHWV